MTQQLAGPPQPAPRASKRSGELVAVSAPVGRPFAARARASAQWLISSGAMLYVVMAITFGAFCLIAPEFATGENMVSIGRITADVSIIAVGMTFVIVAGQIDLSVGSATSLNGMVAAIVLEHAGIVPGILAGLATGVAIGLFNGFITAYVGVPAFLVTLGMLTSLSGVSEFITGTIGVPVMNKTFVNLFGDHEVFHIPASIIWTVVVVAIGWFVLHRTVYGRHVFAVGGNLNAARLSGINTKRTIMTVFVATGILAALSGLILDARFNAANPDAGTGLELQVIAAVIVGGTNLFGGRGGVLRSLLGAVFIGSILTGLILMGSSAQMQEIVEGAVIILAVSLSSLSSKMGRK